jgi:uncharacterized protein
MTPLVPGYQRRRAGTTAERVGRPVTLVLSREVRAGPEGAFEDVLHLLADQVGRQPGHLDVTVLRPPPGGPAHLHDRLALPQRCGCRRLAGSPARARLVAEASLHAAGELHTRYLSGLEGWLAAPGAPVLVPPARRKTALVSAAGILPLLEAVRYLLAPRLAGLPGSARLSPPRARRW